MDFFGKDKLSRLDEERQRRRQQRAEEALRRLEEVGKQTQQLVANHTTATQTSAPNEAVDASGRRPGGLSRVLFEQATAGGEKKRGKNKFDPRSLLTEGEQALAKIDGAMSAIKSSVVDATGAGLRGGLEEASKSVTDIVDRVAALANGTVGTLSPSANKNPLAKIMQDEAAEELKEKHEAVEEEREDHSAKLSLENKLDSMKSIAEKVTGMDGERRGGDNDEGSFQFQAHLQEVLPHDAMKKVMQGHADVNLREIAANAASHVIAKGDKLGGSIVDAAQDLVHGEDAKTIAANVGGFADKITGGLAGKLNNAAHTIGGAFERTHLGDAVSGAVHALSDAAHAGPFGGVVDMAMGAAEKIGASGVVDRARDAIEGGISQAQHIFDPANVANIAMNAATMAPQNLVNNVKEVAQHFDPGHLIANATEKLSAFGAGFDANAMLSNLGNALDPSNFAKLAGTLNPTNLVGIAGHALENVTARLKDAAEVLNPNTLKSEQLEARDPSTGRAVDKHEPLMPSPEHPAGNPDKLAKPQDAANKSDIKQDPAADPKGMKPSDLAPDKKTAEKAGPDKETKLDEKAGAATDKKEPGKADKALEAKETKKDGGEAHKKLDTAGDGKHDKPAGKGAAEAAHKGEDHAAAKGAASHAAHAGTATAAGHAAAKSTGAAAATANQQTGQAAPARGPQASPTGAPQSNKPVAERAKAATPPTKTPHGKQAAPVTPGSGGAMQINPQAVGSAPAKDVAQNEKVVTQPNVTIEARGDSAALPGMPADLASQNPTTGATAAGAAAGAAVGAAGAASAAQASSRTVAPLPNAAPAPTPAARANAPTNVTMPTVKGAPMAAGAAAGAAAASATPQPKTTSGATQAGAQSVPANAQAAPPPPAAALPQQKAVPGTAAPSTPSTQAPEPNIPAVKAPGGDGAPNPVGMVPQTANLSADRSNAQQQLTAEAQTQSKVGPEANAQKQSQVASQKPAFEQTKRSGDAPRQQALTASTTQGQQAGTAGKQRGAAAAQSGNQQIQGQGQGAAAERGQLQSTSMQQGQTVMQQSSPAVMNSAAAPAQAAVAATAAAARAAQAMVNPGAVARAGQAGATPSTLPPFDGAKFGAIDAQLAQPTPEMDMAAADTGKQAAEQTYQQANTQIDQLANIQPPAIAAPAGGGAGAKTKDGQPTRESAIANVEQQVSAQMSAQGPAKMKEAASPLQQEIKQHATSAQQAATTSADSQLAQHKAKEQQIKQQQPPTTGAQAAAAAQPQYQANQAQATAASASMKAEIASAQTAANAGTQQAKAARDASIQQGQAQYQTQAAAAQQQYSTDQQSAKTAFDAQNQTAQTAMASEQQQATTAAQQQTTQAQQKADADIAQQNAQLNTQQQAANASHQQQMEAANQQHDAQVQAAQAQMDSEVASQQSQMQSQVSAEQTRGNAEVDRHLQEGEQGYQREIQSGEQQAQAEKARAEAEAAEKERQAQAEKDKNSGGVFGKVVGWVQDRFNDMMNAVKSVLAAARDLIVSIMEKARQAAIAVLNKARQAALAALNAVKSAIQGIISACASAIRSLISACASLVRNLIQGLANMLKSIVQALTTLLQTLVQAFQAAVNALLDGLIAAVSLINKDLGDKLRSATQKYRDAFNGAMNNLQQGIQQAGQALQNKIQQAADGAIAVVNAAEQTLNAAVTRVEQTLNAAVEAAYQVGAAAINKAFDAAEAVVNKAFEVAEAAVKAYFDAQIAALDLVQQGVNAVADFVVAVADKVLEAVAKIAEAVINMIPESWTKAFVDFWNGPWRQAIIIGLATVAAVAITVATCGAAGPVAMILVAGLIGGTIAGTAYAGGELLAREGAIHLTEEHPGEGVYVPGVGNVQIQIGPDGKPIPPANLTPEQQAAWEKNSQWALSNFNTQRDAEGNVTGYDRKSGSEIANYAVQEGMKGFGEGFISAAGAMGGSLAGGAVAGLGFVGRVASNPVARQMIAGVVEGGVGVVSQSVGAGWTAGFDAMAEGKSPSEAFSAAWKAGSDSITDPGNWVAGMASVGVIPLKTKAIAPLLDRATGRVANQAVKTVIHESVDVATDTMAETIGNAGGAFTSAYYKAIQEGKSPSEAFSAGTTAAGDSFSPEAIAQSLVMNAAGNRANKAAENYAARHTTPGNPNHDPVTSRMPDDPTPDGMDHPTTTPRAADPTPRVDTPPHADQTTRPVQADGTPTPDNNPRTTRGGDESNPTPRKTDSDSTEVIRNTPPAGADNGPPVRHSSDPDPVRTKPADDPATTRRPGDPEPVSTTKPRDTDVDPSRPRDGDDRARAIDQDQTPQEGKRQQNESTQTSLDGHTVKLDIRDVSPEGRHVIRQLEKNGSVRVSEISPEALVEASKWFGKEVAVVQSPAGKLRIVLGEVDGILTRQIKPGEVFVVHTHPVMTTDKSHFKTDLQNAGVHTEAVIDWNGQVTYFNKGGILNPVSPLDGRTVLPIEGYRAAFMGDDGKIVGYAKIDVIDGPSGSTVKVREMNDSGPSTPARAADVDQPPPVRNSTDPAPTPEAAPVRQDAPTRPRADGTPDTDAQPLRGQDGQPLKADDSDASQQTQEQKPRESQDGKRFQDRETDQARVDQQMSEKGHSGIEVHSHFMGNVDPASFASAIARSGDAPMLKPHEGGDTASQRMGDHSPYEPVMREIAKLNELRHTTTEGADGQQVITTRGRSGDALAQIDAAAQRIETLNRRLETEPLSPDQRRAIELEIHNEARSAVEKALRASDETDFNSAYEVRDELVKKFYGASERNEMFTRAGIDPQKSKMTDPGVADAYRAHFEGQVGPDGKPLRQDVIDRIDQAVEAQRRLDNDDGTLSKSEKSKLQKQADSLKEQMAYDQYAKETIVRLAEDGITYTEQSNSINKLAARFDPGQIEALKAELRQEYAGNPRMLQAINNLEIKHVAMVNTNLFGVRGDQHKGDGSQVRTDDLHAAANTTRGDDRTKFRAEVDNLMEQVKRGDVVGVDIAGAEHFSFDNEARGRMTELYDRLASDPDVPKPIVLRPHVGEGANDTIPGMPGHRDANRQMVDGPDGPELSHYQRARENLDSMLKVFEEIAARPGNNGKLPPDVIVRFGHATHTTPEMAARMAKLGIIAEVNLTSNIETGSVSQKPAADPKNKQDNVYQPKPEDQRTPYEIDPEKRQGGALDDHAFTSLVAADAPIILSTDAHSVMSTNMANEYRRATDLINEVRSGQRKVAIDQSVIDPSLPPGTTRNLSYDEMPPHLKERFDNAQRKLYEDANRYFDMRPRQDGEGGADRARGIDVDPDGPQTSRPIKSDDFEMANLAKSTNDPEALAQRGQFNEKMATWANDAVDALRSGKSAEEVYQQISRQRAEANPPDKRAKFETKIQDGDPNFDPFGDMPGRAEKGVPTQDQLQRQRTGEDIKARFDGVTGDTIQTKIRLRDGTIVDGNKLHRGAAADDINAKKGNKYGYDDGAEKFITETAKPADQQRLHDAGIAEIDRLLGMKDQLQNATPAQRAQAMADFADAAYMLFHGPVINRGSDSTIRVMLTASYTEMFGVPPKLPQDIDIRAYSKDQDTFRADLSKALLDQGNTRARAIDIEPTNDTPAAVRKPQNAAETESAKQLNQSADQLRQTFGDRLSNFDTTLVPPPSGKRVLQQSPSDALIGLPVDVIPATGSGADAIARLQAEGIPRWGGLTAKERGHETAFADHLEQNLPAAVAEYTARSYDKEKGTYVFEVDAAKKLYEAYGAGKAPEGADQLDVRASANHAMHPAAVAIARAAFLTHIDTLAALPAGDSRRSIFVTNGGCASGKGSLGNIVKDHNDGKFEFGAMWDAAGEGDAQENGWILQAAQARGLKVTYGMVESDPSVTYNGVLDRAGSSGRIVDPVTFARSYVRGQENMRAFLDSPEYKAAQARGEVDAIGVYTGRFDQQSKSFPDKHLLGDDGRIGAEHLGGPMDEAAVTKNAIEVFEQFLAREQAAGRPTDHWFEGGAVNPLKFGDQPVKQDAKTAPIRERKDQGGTLPVLSKSRPKDIPESVPGTREEVRGFVRENYKNVVGPQEAHPKRSSPEYQGLIDELKTFKPGELGKPENKAKAKELLDRWMEISKTIEGGPDESGLRTLYNEVEKANFPQWMESIAHLPKQQQAELAHMYREELKAYVREMMTDAKSVEVLNLRDRAVYGSEKGPSFDMLFNKALKKHNGDVDLAYDEIIGSSQRSNKDVNKGITGSETGLKPKDDTTGPIRERKEPPKRPLTEADRVAVQKVQEQIASMKVKPVIDPSNPHQKQLGIGFDGTGNDRAKMEHDTNVSKLLDGMEGETHYERGVATDGDFMDTLDYATGEGLRDRVDSAYNNLVEQVNALKGQDPNAQVVLAVTGFSRGAAAARVFVNELQRRGVPVLDSQRPDGSFAQYHETPKVGVMVLFDTVSMSARHNNLSIPTNVDNVLHLTANDERRQLFPLTRATDPSRPNPNVTEVGLPGSHGDIGGGMNNRYSDLPLGIAHQFMDSAGFAMKPRDSVNVYDPSLRLHDTGSTFGLRRREFDAPIREEHAPGTEASRDAADAQPETRVIRPELQAKIDGLKPGESVDLGRRGGKDGLVEYLRHQDVEYGVFKDKDGNYYVMKGTVDSLTPRSMDDRLIAHNHPGGTKKLSPDDVAYILSSSDGKQRATLLLTPGEEGGVQRHYVSDYEAEMPPVGDKGPIREVKPDDTTAPTDPPRPGSLAALFATKGKKIDDYKSASKWELETLANELLAAKGIHSPTDSQKVETLYQLDKAIKKGDATYEAPFEAGAIKKEDGVNERLGNIFGEKRVFDASELTPAALRMNDYERAQLDGGFESGAAGQVRAASFINSRHRSEGDFSHAYGAEGWKNQLRAETYLNTIPKGAFVDGLTVEVMQEVNRLIHTPDTGMKAQMLRTLAFVGRGFKWDVGGEIREGKQYARPEHYSDTEIENLHEAGVETKKFPMGMGHQLRYPAPETIRPRLNEMIAELKANLAKPDADPVGAAAQFQRHFVALHPFGDSNGRTSRALMNRILYEFDMPPAIFADQNADMSLSPAQWREEVAKGVARSKAYLGQYNRNSKDGYVGAVTNGGMTTVSPNKPITVDGLPFDLGADGFLYDPMGRPYMVQNDELIPMAQLEHLMLSRRIAGAGRTEAPNLLASTNESTRQFYDRIAADPDAAKTAKVRDDARARKADQEYRLSPDPEVGALLAKLSDPALLDPTRLFGFDSNATSPVGTGTKSSAILSKYQQMDLELWYIEKGLRDSKQPEMIEQVRASRAKLFEMARAELAKTSDPSRVSAENPHGFRFKYEAMMHDTSPLRFASFDEALRELGDKRTTVWRGDYSFSKLMGMAPNNDVRQADAKAIANQRAKKGQITDIYDDLVKLEGTAVGRQYICTTSDLALLVNFFANTSNSQQVNLSFLPAPMRETVLRWMAPEFPPGTSDADKQKAYDEAKARKEKIIATPDGGREIRDVFGIPGTIIRISNIDKTAGTITVMAERKAFKIDLDKDAFLPGIYSMGGPIFEDEQELHGLETVRPWKIKDTVEAGKLKEEFPVNTAPASTTPTTPAPGPGGTGFGDGGDHVEATGRGEGGATLPATDATPMTTGAKVEWETEWAAADGSGMKRSDVGVGEKVYFTADSEGTWSASGGTKSGSGSTFDWLAPEKAGGITVTFTPTDGKKVTYSIQVHAPTSVVLTKTTTDTFASGTMGAGFRANVAFHPLNVSFAATEWKEDTGQAGEGATGYFVGKTLPTHDANPKWLGIGKGNSGPTDHASFSGFPSPWSEGSFKWSIAQRWKLRSSTTENFIHNLEQVCTLEGAPHAGRTTVTKGGADATRSPSGPGGGKGGKPTGTGRGEADHTLDHGTGIGFSEDAAGVGVGKGNDEKAPPTSSELRNMLETYLSYNDRDVWRSVGEHFFSVAFPTGHARLTWGDHKQFVTKTLMQLESWVKFRPITMLDEVLHPASVVSSLGAYVPTNKAWEPQVGIAVAHALHIAVVASIKRLAVRYLAVADSKGSSGTNAVRFDELVTSSAIDRFVAPGLCWTNVLSVASLSGTDAKAARGKPVGIKAVELKFEGARDKRLWNWVRVTPADATAEDVAAKIWKVVDDHKDPSASFNAWLLAAAPPLFGVPKRMAMTNENFRQYAPADAEKGDDSVEAQLLHVANLGSATDDAALNERVVAPEVESGKVVQSSYDWRAVSTIVDDCNTQLEFVQKPLRAWNLAGNISPAKGFLQRKAAELPTLDERALTNWGVVVSGQKERLLRISGAMTNVLGKASKLGITDPASEQATPLREILALYATAAGISHLATPSEAKLLQAYDMQSRLAIRALQSTEASMMGAIRDVHQQAGDNKHTSNLSFEAVALQERSRNLQAQMLNGTEVDQDEFDDVSVKSEEIALESRMYGALDGLADINKAARESLKGDAAIIASLFSGSIRDLPELSARIFNDLKPIRNHLDSFRKGYNEEEKWASKDHKRQNREKRREVLKTVREKFDKLAQDRDLNHFFQKATEVIENQQFRTACVKVAAMIGISIVGGAVAGLAARAVGGVLMEATGVATVGELGLVARTAIVATNVGVDATISAAGTSVIQGTSFTEAWQENVITSLASSALFGSFSRYAKEQAELEGRIAKTWKDSGKLGKLAIVGKELGSLTAHTLWGAAMGTVAGKIVTGKTQPPPSTLREWALQGISVAVGKHVQQRLVSRSKFYQSLEEGAENRGRGLVKTANKLTAMARDVISSEKPQKALDLLDEHDKFLREEIEAVDRALAKATDPKKRAELEAQRDNLKIAADTASGTGMAETRMALTGMEELVPGALWKGTEKQIRDAEAATGGKATKKNGRWQLKVGKRTIEIHEVASPQKTVDVERIMLKGDDHEMAMAAKLVVPKPGTLDVMVHGSVDEFVVMLGGKEVKLSHRSFAKYIKSKGIKFTRLRLLSCKAGMHPKGVAQHLSNKLGVPVEAPSDKLYIHPDGTMTIGPHETRNTGKWEEFTPQKSSSRYQTAPDPQPTPARTGGGTAARTPADATTPTAPKPLGRAKAMGPDEDAELLVHFGPAGHKLLQTQLGSRYEQVVMEVGPQPIVDAKSRWGETAAINLADALGGKRLQTLLVEDAKNLKLQMDPSGLKGTYRYAGTNRIETVALKGTGARKTPSASGARVVTLIANGKTVTFTERMRYDDVKIDPTKLTATDQAAINKLLAKYHISDAGAKAKVYEAIEHARINDSGADIPKAIKKHVDPLLENVQKAGAKGTPALTAEQVITQQGKHVPINDVDPAVLAEAQNHIATGILNEPEFKKARTQEELRDLIVTDRMRATAKSRAEKTVKGGHVVTKMRFLGDFYADAHTTTPTHRNVDLIPDIDVAYLVPTGSGFDVAYVGSGKVVEPQQVGRQVKDAKSQNAKAKLALAAGASRFEVETDSGMKWAEVRKVTGEDPFGAVDDFTNKLKMSTSTTFETIGGEGKNSDKFNATMVDTDLAKLNAVVDTIWRIAELQKR